MGLKSLKGSGGVSVPPTGQQECKPFLARLPSLDSQTLPPPSPLFPIHSLWAGGHCQFPTCRMPASQAPSHSSPASSFLLLGSCCLETILFSVQSPPWEWAAWIPRTYECKGAVSQAPTVLTVPARCAFTHHVRGSCSSGSRFSLWLTSK